MPNIYILKRPKLSAVSSFQFSTYNEAIAFMLKSSALNPSKPYKRIIDLQPLWFVTIGGTCRKTEAEYIKIPAGSKPQYLGLAA